ncbi:hypothetical protein Pelo_8520 [Pelomyxa schiedti]|nr:hypothetical protein Pelo_8520 [Pelomyxa schiedti]
MGDQESKLREHSDLNLQDVVGKGNNISSIKKIVLPTCAAFSFAGQGEDSSGASDGKIHIELVKTVAYRGDKTIKSATVHNSMGVAYKLIGDELQIGTWGEWEGNSDGSALINLTCTNIPKKINVRLSAAHCGEHSVACGVIVAIDYGDTWFGCRQPGPDWLDIPRVY